MSDQTRDRDEDRQRGPQGGERLAEARRLRQISLPDIARELHLDEAKVQALEENRFDVLGAPVFAKGHLRKYAELVNVPIDDVLADYYKMNRAAGAPPVVAPPRDRPPRDLNLGPWLVGVPLLLIVLAAVYWWLGRTPAEEPRQTPPAVERSQAVQPAADSEPDLAEPVARELPASAAGDPVSGEATATLPATTADSTPPPASASPVGAAPAGNRAATPGPAAAPPSRTLGGSGDVSLTLAYTGDCWTEVTDGNGERLFFDLGRDGRTVRLGGPPPLRILLGDTNNVSLSVDGEPYDISPGERRGDTARLTIRR